MAFCYECWAEYPDHFARCPMCLAWTPSPAEIAAEMQRIRNGWSEHEEQRRRIGPVRHAETPAYHVHAARRIRGILR